MITTSTLTKKTLEKIISETFYLFGDISSSSLLDSLKLLGFYYATNAGISINIEDLKTPDSKKKYLKETNKKIKKVSNQWIEGEISDTERFQSIIDTWNSTTEALKNRIIDYYQNFDPLNNLYIMAFSGARGNMSQVRQLVGMRGLMSDQEGNIIDLPIQRNFREGLNSIDYIISSYGARKGIVDTALKTADSGYLTRRLIYLTQSLIIGERDCKTKEGILVFFDRNKNINNILGRSLISYKTSLSEEDHFLDIVLDKKILQELKEKLVVQANIRSPLMCKAQKTICQKCYGWDLSRTKLVSLGEAVGVIAAQSIGEPGTQLTMRTFHTGGIFTSELIKETLAPFSGRLVFPKSFKGILFRTTHGVNVLKVQQDTRLTLIDWKGRKEDVILEVGSFLYIFSSSFVKKGQLIAESSKESSLLRTKQLKPIYSPLEGEIQLETLMVRSLPREDKADVIVNQEDGVLWLTSGKILSLDKEAKETIPSFVKKNKALAYLKIVSPYNASVHTTKEGFLLSSDEKEIFFDSSFFENDWLNLFIKIIPVIKNEQYIDEYSVIAYYSFFPTFTGKVYSIRTQVEETTESSTKIPYFLVTESDIWKINADELTVLPKQTPKQANKKVEKELKKTNEMEDKYGFDDKYGLYGVPAASVWTSTSNLSHSGCFLKMDGFRAIFQKAIPIFLSRGTILNSTNGDFIQKSELLATLLNYTQQTQDIVQGLPKIEELIEARIPLLKCFLAKRPGIVWSTDIDPLIPESIEIEENHVTFLFKPEMEYRSRVLSKQRIQIYENSFHKKKLIVYDNQNSFWSVTEIPKGFFLSPSNSKKTSFNLINPLTGEKFKSTKGYKRFEGPCTLRALCSDYEKPYLSVYNGQKFTGQIIELQPKTDVYVDSKGYSILCELAWPSDCVPWAEKPDTKTEGQNVEYIFLEKLFGYNDYLIPYSSKRIVKKGQFVDLAQPLSEGVMDPHELLSLLFSYQLSFDGNLKACIRSFQKFQLILANSIQAIYESQGVNIDNRHIEMVVRQLTTNVLIRQGGNSPYYPGEITSLIYIIALLESMKVVNEELVNSEKNSYLRENKGYNAPQHSLTKAYRKARTRYTEMKIHQETLVAQEIRIFARCIKSFKELLDFNAQSLLIINKEGGNLTKKGILKTKRKKMRYAKKWRDIYEMREIGREMKKKLRDLVHQDKELKKKIKEFSLLVKKSMSRVLALQMAIYRLIEDRKHKVNEKDKDFSIFEKNQGFSFHPSDLQVYNRATSVKRKDRLVFPQFEPIFLSTTSASLMKEGFLAAAGFQETKRVLTKAALEGTEDWLKGLKEHVITGKLIKVGSSFLDSTFQFENLSFNQKEKKEKQRENEESFYPNINR